MNRLPTEDIIAHKISDMIMESSDNDLGTSIMQEKNIISLYFDDDNINDPTPIAVFKIKIERVI